MLEFEGKWRYESPGSVEKEVVWAFRQLIDRICGQGRRKAILEHFKSHFASAAGLSVATVNLPFLAIENCTH